MVEDDGKRELSAVEYAECKLGLLDRLVLVDGLGEEIRSNFDPCICRAIEVCDDVIVFAQKPGCCTSIAQSHHGELDTVLSYAIPVDIALVLRYIDARACDVEAVFHIVETAVDLAEVLPLVGVRFPGGFSGRLAAKSAACAYRDRDEKEREDGDGSDEGSWLISNNVADTASSCVQRPD